MLVSTNPVIGLLTLNELRQYRLSLVYLRFIFRTEVTALRHSEQVLTASSMMEFFRDSVSSAMRNQNVDADEHTVFYVVSLLKAYGRSERFYDAAQEGRTLRPLAQLYGDAVQATTTEERDAQLRRLGDVALFVAGVFAESGLRRGIDVDYYINMGGGAYNWLGDRDQVSRTYAPLADTFAELAEKFVQFVDVLAEVCESANLQQDRNLLRVYERWQKTGSPRARRQLVKEGIVPLAGAGNDGYH